MMVKPGWIFIGAAVGYVLVATAFISVLGFDSSEREGEATKKGKGDYTIYGGDEGVGSGN